MSTRTLLLRGSTLLVAISLLLINWQPTMAMEAELIKIQPVGKDKIVGFSLDPVDLKVEKNTVVIWLNSVQGKDIQVIFMDGKTCKDVSANQKEFSLNSENCYVTTFMRYGKTSSLQFVESGTYKYYVATERGDIKATGSIIVK